MHPPHSKLTNRTWLKNIHIDAYAQAQHFPHDPNAETFPPHSTDPKVTASVQVPLRVEVERRKRLFSNQDIAKVRAHTPHV
jgi:hypothetical protein